MKMLAFICGLLLTVTAQAAVLEPTDGDVDSIIIDGGLNEGQMVAFTLPDTIPGAFWSLDVTTLFTADEKLSTDFLTGVLGGSEFSVYLWDTIDWVAPTTEIWAGDDAIVLEWQFANGIDAFESVEIVIVDVQDMQAVPIPAAIWLFGSGLIGLVGVGRGLSK